MKIMKFKVEVATMDCATDAEIQQELEAAANGSDGVFAAEVTRCDDGPIMVTFADGTGAPCAPKLRQKRKYTRRLKPVPERENPVVNSNGEKVTRRVNADGDVVETRT